MHTQGRARVFPIHERCAEGPQDSPLSYAAFTKQEANCNCKTLSLWALNSRAVLQLIIICVQISLDVPLEREDVLPSLYSICRTMGADKIQSVCLLP